MRNHNRLIVCGGFATYPQPWKKNFIFVRLAFDRAGVAAYTPRPRRSPVGHISERRGV